MDPHDIESIEQTFIVEVLLMHKTLHRNFGELVLSNVESVSISGYIVINWKVNSLSQSAPHMCQ